MIAVLLGWALSVFQIRALSMAMLVALTAGGLVNHGISFGYNFWGLTSFNYVHPPVNDPSNRQLLTAAVRATCHDGNDGRWNVLGVAYTWLNGHAAIFASAKEALREGSRPCMYMNYDWREKDTVRAIDTIFSIKAQYIITVSAEKQPQMMEGVGEPKFANVISLSIAEALARDPRFVRTPESNNTVLIYQPAAEARPAK